MSAKKSKTTEEKKLRRARVEVNPGRKEKWKDDPDRNVGIIAILFKEVLQDLPEGNARALVDGYRKGGTLVLKLRQNSRGVHFVTQFSWGLEPSTPESGEFLDWTRRNIDAENG